MRESLCAAISAEPDLYVVESAAGAPDAIRLMVPSLQDVLFLERQPDLVLLSLDNPGQVDVQTLEKVHKQLPGSPILALLSDEVPGQPQMALWNGAQAAITMTATRDELIRALRAITMFSLLTPQSAV